ncbi:RNA polymerase sigma factor [Polluticaenibacter yanchengensis]|uniref:RNA polymerase sigma factor n=1 Tax=Polluticaenibacter yanchengensis TaxID=3014562 RepID=A0ABT4UJH2_9BACT|nr:sigma-70 family RNA polymerase sigma factor [Chitinophagaceae bacterium LY-5]
MALKSGESQAYKQLVTLNESLVYNTCLSIVQSEIEAEDITQEVFVKAFESIQSFKGDSKLSTWLYKITVTKSLDFLRSKKRKKRSGFLMSIFGDNNELIINPPDFHHPGVSAENKQQSAILFKAISQLPEQQKTAYILTRIENLGHKEVSEIMNTSVPAIESLLQRAKNNLKKLLENYYRQEKE